MITLYVYERAGDLLIVYRSCKYLMRIIKTKIQESQFFQMTQFQIQITYWTRDHQNQYLITLRSSDCSLPPIMINIVSRGKITSFRNSGIINSIYIWYLHFLLSPPLATFYCLMSMARERCKTRAVNISNNTSLPAQINNDLS